MCGLEDTAELQCLAQEALQTIGLAATLIYLIEYSQINACFSLKPRLRQLYLRGSYEGK